jgi:predicted transcriptional regulator
MRKPANKKGVRVKTKAELAKLAQQIVAARKKAGLTQVQLVTRLGVSIALLSRMENGKGWPKQPRIVATVKLFLETGALP